MQLDACVPIGELPANGCSGGVARVFERVGFPDESFPVTHAPIPTQPVKDTRFQFCHVEPTPVFRCVVNGPPAKAGGLKMRVKRA